VFHLISLTTTKTEYASTEIVPHYLTLVNTYVNVHFQVCIERKNWIVNGQNKVNVYFYCMKLNGHHIVIITLKFVFSCLS
jgi:hypothetical protein